ncbi:mitochondrial inner membrane protease ATP23 [Paracoccidioides brasiliensis Pb18]|uniref:Mitochondrial inner membrane protease ATP23 n=1 Tax=Paracoccidioides brasiliensis (strain Pb18) TaxID=502780 RepID=C1GDG9_PARBD|nr:mitochondrial inner membrane protease ATP23 [Paracoccidioides brasiliensis Pb18]EEH49226.2 mitochondrial inner membrane protease ATP23 [Paracoccidioides brasiliensis Pb18]
MEESKPSAANSGTVRPAKDTGFTPGDDIWTQMKNMFSILTGKMTDEGREQFLLARDIRNEEIDCKRCEDQRDYLIKYSPIIRFLQDNIKQLGGDISSYNIHCRRCTQRQAGGFDPEYGIRICANAMKDQGHIEDTMAHEMIHAYDHLRFKLDWTDNLRHAACAEESKRVLHLDPSKFIKRRVQMGKRVLPARPVEVNTAASRVCAASGGAISHGQAGL